MEKLIEELKLKIIDLLNLIDVRPEDVGADDILIGGPLGLDSIDILEMVIMLDRDYGIKINNRELGMKVFASLRAMAAFVQENSPET